MGALETARDHYVARQAAWAAARAEEPAWLARMRREAAACFAEAGLPHTRLEEWRYTNLGALARIPFELSGGPAKVSREALERVCFPVEETLIYSGDESSTGETESIYRLHDGGLGGCSDGDSIPDPCEPPS
jgi:hypothetical protein